MSVKNYFTSLLILLQQTGLQPKITKIGSTDYRLNAVLKLLVCCFASLNTAKILEDYKKSNYETANYLKELKVSNQIVSVLDIGCGIAGYHSDWMLDGVGDLYLFDNSTFNFASLGYGMGDENRYYNSLPLAKRYLAQQGIALSRIQMIESKENHFNLRKYDLIVSFISLGFHYHVDTYWGEILKSLNQNGMIVLDVRNGSSSDTFISNEISSGTCSVMSSVNHGKFTRFCLQKTL
jgi:hypothetical protein